MNWNSVLGFLKAAIPIIVSVTALLIVLLDRRPSLKLQGRSPAWYSLKPAGKYVAFRGIVEIYNLSARANAVRDFQIWWKKDGVRWEKTATDRFAIPSEDGSEGAVYNQTPLTLAPYSGAEARIMGIIALKDKGVEIEFQVVVEDVFGKHYDIVVKASS